MRKTFGWIWRLGRAAGDGGSSREVAERDDRALLLRILAAVVWLPIQVTLGLFFATGGIFFVLLLGIVAGPFIGLYFLVQHLLRRDTTDVRPGSDAGEDPCLDSTARDDAPLPH